MNNAVLLALGICIGLLVGQLFPGSQWTPIAGVLGATVALILTNLFSRGSQRRFGAAKELSPDAPPQLEYHPKDGAALASVEVTRLPFHIGKGAAADLSVRTPKMSDDHATIFGVGTEYWIKDLGSAHGTFVNGWRVTEARIASGDMLRLGDKELRFHCSSSPREFGAPDPERIEVTKTRLRDADWK